MEYKDGADFITSPLTETVVLQGMQNAYGVEFMIQKTTGRLDGWISYTYSRSEMLVRGETDYESINNGNPYPSNFDRPHVLNVVANYSINRRFSIEFKCGLYVGPSGYLSHFPLLHQQCCLHRLLCTEPVQDSGLFQNRSFA